MDKDNDANKNFVKKNKMADAVDSHICVPVTPTSTKARKSLRDDSDNSIDDFIVDEFRAHREAALKRHKRECVTSNVDTNPYTHRKKIEPKSSQGADREKKGTVQHVIGKEVSG